MNRRTIAAAGLDLLDETGLDGLTVRKLAARLDVKSPALYWHFKSKHELLDEMAQLLESEQDRELPGEHEAWDAWMTRQARARRRILLSRRDGARLIAGSRGGEAVLSHLDAAIAALRTKGFTAVQALRALTTINSYVTGFVLEEQADRQRHEDTGETPPEDMTAEQQEQLLHATPALAASIRDGGDPGGPAAFEDGLRMIVAGIGQSVPSPPRHLD
ncbi:tetracycline resistance transcriptional repressor TetR(A) [Glycomyces halotolerans]